MPRQPFFLILPSLCHVSHLFSNPSPHFFFWLFFLTLPILFFQPFPSIFGSSSLHYSTPYRYNSFNSSSPFLTLLLPIIPHLTVTISLTLPLPSPHFFYKFAITPSTHLSSIQSMFYLQKKVITLLSLNLFINYFLQICS